ncbi:heat shock 70kDa protein 1/2/6/8 [Paragonimus westermani]|uniref:Heat shock 70kDa protein 1/2/6/8 n=1 Tax=Paragonimus westermani TaxID=34504 RepID=A0A5J4NXJ8_9TREM|nr:heat shock 70kDa protein 1/2/6/8 [Paragonimus westermani]
MVISVGISLGYAVCRVAVARGHSAEILLSSDGSRDTPTCVSFTKWGHLVGNAAQAQLPFNRENTVYDILVLIGRKYNDPMIQRYITQWDFKLVDIENRLYVKVTNAGKEKLLVPEQLLAIVLHNLKMRITAHLKGGYGPIVISVPAHFNEQQRQAVRTACLISNLPISNMIDSTVAGMINFGFLLHSPRQCRVLFCEQNDEAVAVLTAEIDDQNYRPLSQNFEMNLGGRDQVENLLSHLLELCRTNNNLDLNDDKKVIRQLRDKCKQVLHNLGLRESDQLTVQIHNQTLALRINREEITKTILGLRKRIDRLIEHSVNNSRLKTSQIDHLVCLQTYAPAFILREHFNGKPINKIINLTEAEACGSALWPIALVVSNDQNTVQPLTFDFLPSMLKLEVNDGDVVEIFPKTDLSLPATSNLQNIAGKTCNSMVSFNLFVELNEVLLYIGELSFTNVQNIAVSYELKCELNKTGDFLGSLKVGRKIVSTATIKNVTQTVSEKYILQLREEYIALIADTDKYQKAQEHLNDMQGRLIELRRQLLDYKNNCDTSDGIIDQMLEKCEYIENGIMVSWNFGPEGLNIHLKPLEDLKEQFVKYQLESSRTTLQSTTSDETVANGWLPK